MSVTETYQCDICARSKAPNDIWWLAWIDCMPGETSDQTQPAIQITRWQNYHAHNPGVSHLCGAQCAARWMDRWITAQHEDPDQQCATD
jgi:hypothetical protein